jgi:glycosyltransferase involved in cell wall biosynthesis
MNVALSPPKPRQPLKVLVVIASLEIGGAQRLVVDLINNMDRKRLSLSLALSKATGGFLPRIPSDCNVFDLERSSWRDFPWLILKLAWILRKERPDVVLSVLQHSNILAFLARLISRKKMPIVMSEHISAHHYLQCQPWMRRLIGVSYQNADCMIAVSKGVADEMITYWGLQEERVKMIYNPVDLDSVKSLGAEPLSMSHEMQEPIIISVGRFTRQKGYSYLLHAFAEVSVQIPCTLVLVGDGEDRRELEQLALDLGIKDRTVFTGLDSNPYRWISRSNVFVLSSLYEGFAIVLLEALALGIPVIASDCPHGPSEILRNGRDGLLVPPSDSSALAQALLTLLKDDQLRQCLSFSGTQRVEDFSIRKIADQYAEVLQATSVMGISSCPNVNAHW